MASAICAALANDARGSDGHRDIVGVPQHIKVPPLEIRLPFNAHVSFGPGNAIVRGETAPGESVFTDVLSTDVAGKEWLITIPAHQ